MHRTASRSRRRVGKDRETHGIDEEGSPIARQTLELAAQVNQNGISVDPSISTMLPRRGEVDG